MSIRKIILLVALLALVAVAIGVMSQRREDHDVQGEVEQLVRDFDRLVYLEGNYQQARQTAEQMLKLADASNDQGVRVRGLIRLVFVEICFGKWGNKWGKRIKECQTLVSEKPTTDRAEFLFYLGAIRGRWQSRFDVGLEHVREAHRIADHIKDDRVLALAYINLSELYAFIGQRNLASRNAYLGVTVARHHGQPGITVRALRSLLPLTLSLGSFAEAQSVSEELLEYRPTSLDALFIQFLKEDSGEFKKQIEAYIARCRKRDGERIRRADGARIGKLLRRLASGYLFHAEFEKCVDCSRRAIEYLQLAGDTTSIEQCQRLLKIAQLQGSSEIDKIDEVASGFIEIMPYDAIAEAYRKFGNHEKSLQWRERSIDAREQRNAVDVNYLKQSSELFWDGERKMREQARKANQFAQESQRRVWLLTSALALGSTVCALLGCFYFLLRRERNSLEKTVESRTKSLSKAMEAANAADRAKSDFLAQINHEIRNPLTAILGYCELLTSRSGKSNELVNGIESSSLHLRQLVDRLLEVSRLESVGLEPSLSSFLPARIVGEIEEIMAKQASQKRLDFQCVFQGDRDVAVLSDETIIRQIAINLIGNAIKFTEHGNVHATFHITDQDESKEARLRLVVNDTGIGIQRSEQEAVFDRFTKASNGAAREGSGLGLFITRQLVQCLGGEIVLESRVGEGTVVTVDIPVNVHELAPEDLEDAKGGDDSPPKVSKATKILIVDDQEMIRTLLQKQLVSYGFECESAATLSQTIDLVENWLPDLVLLDLRMPEHSGFEVFEQIRSSRNSNVSVVAMTGDATTEVERKCLGLGFDGFVTKPFQVKDILAMLRDPKST